jgi:hypothetical protein
MDTLLKILPEALVTFGGYVLAHAAIALAHAHGWRPERQLADYIMRSKHKLQKRITRLTRKFEKRPHVDDAPGLVWIRRAAGWEARWRACKVAVSTGFKPKHVRLWVGPKADLSPLCQDFVASRCVFLQAEMLNWQREHRLRVVVSREAA